jgi:hypothetical protein
MAKMKSLAWSAGLLPRPPTGRKEDEFTDYWKQKDIKSAQGSVTAPFAGTHGWYWKSREEVPITITVTLDGFYENMFERE